MHSEDTLNLPLRDWGLGMADVDVRGAFCPGDSQVTATMLDLIRYERIDPTLLITHRLQGWDALPEAFDLMADKPPNLIKPIVILN